MQDKKEKSSLRKQELFYIQLPISLQKDLTKGHSQKKMQKSFRACFPETALIIWFDSNLKRKQFFATFLCKSLKKIFAGE